MCLEKKAIKEKVVGVGVGGGVREHWQDRDSSQVLKYTFLCIFVGLLER